MEVSIYEFALLLAGPYAVMFVVVRTARALTQRRRVRNTKA